MCSIPRSIRGSAMGEPAPIPGPGAFIERAEGVAAPSTRRRRLRRALLRPQAITVELAALVVLIVAIFGPQLAPYDPIAPDPVHEFLGPSAAHLMGTDDLGRDVFSRILAGARYSL